MEEIMSLVKQMQNAGNLDPRIEDLVTKINELQQAIKKMREKNWKANKQRAERRRTIEILKAEHLRFEERLNEKIAAKENVEDHSEEREVMLKSLQKEFLKVKQRFEKCRANIEKIEVRLTKSRIMFEQSLEKVVEALKDCLEREKLMIEADKEHLLSEEKWIQACVENDLDLQRCCWLSEEWMFLKSPGATGCMALIQDEDKEAKEHLETTYKENSDLQERCSKLRAELENVRVQDGGPEED